eukprot:TRINITY_DN61801_c0_g1_i1.p1 TRINITY_DN61801_c0_g1~~TRINITY_DN61801_c0_g1_i1.p1  ORF type:complete len:393 (+),score=92.99 TRINITY_DN61801_c0_g1_i1:129-1307(+)
MSVREKIPKFKRKITQLDFYPKFDSENAQKAPEFLKIIYLCTGFISALLFLSELHHLLNVTVHDQVMVDDLLEEDIRISFNLTFPMLHCDQVSLDALDIAGEQRINADLIKTRLTEHGNPIGESLETKIRVETDYCGPCYGAKPDGECCNTCADVKKAYLEKEWSTKTILQTAEQCMKERTSLKTQQSKIGEGCMTVGTVKVHKVAGAFHVAMGESQQRGHAHIHYFDPSKLSTFNATHTINSLTFGDEFEGQQNPLNGIDRVMDHGFAAFEYEIKLTSFTDVEENRSYQYSVVNKISPIDPDHFRRNQNVPGVYFYYEFSPFAIKRFAESGSFMQFLTNIFAIIGGAVAVAGLIVGFVTQSKKVAWSKMWSSVKTPLSRSKNVAYRPVPQE